MSSVTLSSLASIDKAESSLQQAEQCIDKDALPEVLRRFSELYQHLNSDNLHLLNTLYRDDISFVDPLHKINGLDDLTTYFAGMYANIISINFTINQITMINRSFYDVKTAPSYLAATSQQAHVFWTMQYQHPKLNQGKIIEVDGMSQLFYTDKIYRHRDYFDAGAMLYEQLPLLGRLIGYLKNRIAIS